MPAPDSFASAAPPPTAADPFLGALRLLAARGRALRLGTGATGGERRWAVGPNSTGIVSLGDGAAGETHSTPMREAGR